MLFPSYKDEVRRTIQVWLDTENDHEAMNLKWLHNVALYLYANEYPLQMSTQTSQEAAQDSRGTAILLYDYERMTADQRPA